MKWTDTLDIAIALVEAHPEVDPTQVRFTDLHRWVLALEGFSDDPNKSGEKILEEMITAGDSHRTAALGSHYVILPPMATWDEDAWLARNGGTWAAPDFSYDSGTNDAWLDIPTLSAQVERYLAGEGGQP